MARRRRPGKYTSPLIREALNRITELRAEFDLVRLAAYQKAEDATKGQLLNQRGRDAGIDPYQLFRSNERYARCYASEELIEHWESNLRPTFTRFEQQMFETDSGDQDSREMIPYFDDDEPF